MTIPDTLLPDWYPTLLFYCANVFGVLGMLSLVSGQYLLALRHKDKLALYVFAFGQLCLSGSFFLIYTPSYLTLNLLLASFSIWGLHQRHAGHQTPSARVTDGPWSWLPWLLASVHAMGVVILVVGTPSQAAWAATTAMLFTYLGFVWAKLTREIYLISMIMSNAIGAMHLHDVGHYGVFAITAVTSGLSIVSLTRSSTSYKTEQTEQP